jgi:hypothetical protein
VSMHKIAFSFNGIFYESHILWFVNVLNFKDKLRLSHKNPGFRSVCLLATVIWLKYIHVSSISRFSKAYGPDIDSSKT